MRITRDNERHTGRRKAWGGGVCVLVVVETLEVWGGGGRGGVGGGGSRVGVGVVEVV